MGWKGKRVFGLGEWLPIIFISLPHPLSPLLLLLTVDHRDSISSVNSPDATFLSSFAFPELSEDLLSSFALPVPYTQAHALSSSDMDVVSVKLKEVIVKCQQQDQRPHSVLDHSRSVDRPHMLTSSLFSDSSSTTLTNGAGTGDQVTSPDFDRAISPTSDSLSTSLDDPDGMRCSSALSKNSTQSEDTGLPSSDLIQRDPCCALPKKGSVSRESSKSPDSSKYNGRTDTPDETSSKDSSLVGSRRGSKADMSKSIQDTDMYIDSVFDLDVSAEEACDTPKAESKLFRKGSMDTASRDLSIYSTESAARKPHPLLKRRDTELSIRTPLDSKPVAIIGRSGEGSLKSKRYASISAGSGGTLRGVKPRSNPTATLSMKKVKRPELSTGVFSPAKKVNTKMLKLVLAGNDCLVSSVAHAYCHLLLTEPSLFSGLEILFYYIPLCQASTIYGHTGEIPQMGTNADLPEPFCATTDLTGNTIHIARFLSYLDSWYERNVMLAVHNTLRIIPTVGWLFQNPSHLLHILTHTCSHIHPHTHMLIHTPTLTCSYIHPHTHAHAHLHRINCHHSCKDSPLLKRVTPQLHPEGPSTLPRYVGCLQSSLWVHLACCPGAAQCGVQLLSRG